jgi:hypothetical protein
MKHLKDRQFVIVDSSALFKTDGRKNTGSQLQLSKPAGNLDNFFKKSADYIPPSQSDKSNKPKDPRMMFYE